MDELSYRLIGDLVGLGWCIGFGIGTAGIVHYKGRAWGGWFWYGFFLSFIGLIVVACVPAKVPQAAPPSPPRPYNPSAVIGLGYRDK